MENRHVKKKPIFIRLRVVPLILLLGLIYGCQAKEPPLSPAAAAFKQEINECIAKLVKPLIEPVLKRDSAAINETLKKIEPEAIKLCRMCPFRMGVMNINGDTLAVYPPQKNAHLDFHNMRWCSRPLRPGKSRISGCFSKTGPVSMSSARLSSGRIK